MINPSLTLKRSDLATTSDALLRRIVRRLSMHDDIGMLKPAGKRRLDLALTALEARCAHLLCEGSEYCCNRATHRWRSKQTTSWWLTCATCAPIASDKVVIEAIVQTPRRTSKAKS